MLKSGISSCRNIQALSVEIHETPVLDMMVLFVKLKTAPIRSAKFQPGVPPVRVLALMKVAVAFVEFGQ